jgi:putative methanogen marker protein 4
MFDLSMIHKIAKKSVAKVGCGDAKRGDVITKSVECARDKGFADVVQYADAEKLVKALKSGEIEAAVRGNLGAGEVLSCLKTEFGLKKVLRIAFLVFERDRVVLLAPVGVDEGYEIEERMELVNFGFELLSKFKIEPKVGVLSGGRLEDSGRHMKVDETLVSGEKLTSMALDSGISARHYGILLERAAKESNMLIGPDGITGNLIFRSLNYFGGAKGIGAPVVNLKKIIVDTSRDKNDYVFFSPL